MFQPLNPKAPAHQHQTKHRQTLSPGRSAEGVVEGTLRRAGAPAPPGPPLNLENPDREEKAGLILVGITVPCRWRAGRETRTKVKNSLNFTLPPTLSLHISDSRAFQSAYHEIFTATTSIIDKSLNLIHTHTHCYTSLLTIHVHAYPENIYNNEYLLYPVNRYGYPI